VVDASGRARIIAKRKGLHVPETSLRNASVWGRFEGVADIDDFGDDAFRARVRYTGRRLSTLHFVHSGYWVWFIPLRPGITSIGVVCDHEHFDPAFRTQEGFIEFLRRHRAIASLIEGAKPIDHGCYTNLSYATKQFFSPDRWALVGDAAVFTDPFYSPGADFIALENDFVSDLIRRDLAGEGEDGWRRRLAVYDEFMRFRFEAAQKLYRNQYRHLGSFDLNKLKWDFDVGTYYNLWVSSYVTDQHLDGHWVRRQLRQQPFVLKALDNFAAMIGKVDETLRSEGRYHEHNTGYHNNGHDCLGFFEAELGRPRSDADKLAVTEEIFNRVRGRALDLVGSALPRERWSLAAFMGDAPLI
jgi:flavin-dependent dehydrogenase